MSELQTLKIPARDWARTAWPVKARRLATVMAHVRAAELAHVAAYGYGHPLHNRGNANVRNGALNQPKEFAA